MLFLLGISRWHTRLPTISFINTIQSTSFISLLSVRPILCLWPSYCLIHNNIRGWCKPSNPLKVCMDRNRSILRRSARSRHITTKFNVVPFFFVCIALHRHLHLAVFAGRNFKMIRECSRSLLYLPTVIPFHTFPVSLCSSLSSISIRQRCMAAVMRQPYTLVFFVFFFFFFGKRFIPK